MTTKAPTPRSPNAWGPRAGQSADAQPRTIAGRTAQQLRRDIIQGRLAPGERLTFDKLTKAYGAGSSPLREALFQVAAEGLVHGEDHKGFIVAPINFGEMFDVSLLRAQLEMHAVARSIEQGGDDWETDLLSAAHRLKKTGLALAKLPEDERRDAEDEWEQRHREFHFALCSACGSPWLLHFFAALYDQLERYRRHFWRYAERAAVADDEHEQILKAALSRDSSGARSLLEEHFRKQAAMTLATVQAANAPPSQAARPARAAAAKKPPSAGKRNAR